MGKGTRLNRRLEQLKVLHDLTCEPGCVDLNEYMFGIARGVDMALHVMTGVDDYKPLPKPEQFLEPYEHTLSIEVDSTGIDAAVDAALERVNAAMAAQQRAKQQHVKQQDVKQAGPDHKQTSPAAGADTAVGSKTIGSESDLLARLLRDQQRRGAELQLRELVRDFSAHVFDDPAVFADIEHTLNKIDANAEEAKSNWAHFQRPIRDGFTVQCEQPQAKPGFTQLPENHPLRVSLAQKKEKIQVLKKQLTEERERAEQLARRSDWLHSTLDHGLTLIQQHIFPKQWADSVRSSLSTPA